MAIMYNGWIWRKYNSLIFIVLLTELYTYLCKYYYPDFLYINFLNGVNGQLNLWVDRQLVIQIIESMPHNQNIPSKLRCPRRLPEIHRHSKLYSYIFDQLKPIKNVKYLKIS